MILILSNPTDIHARHVANLLRQRGRDVLCVPRSDFGNGAALSLRPEARRGTLTIDGVKISSDDISAVWYRRPGRVHAAPAITDALDRSFAENEWAQGLDGFLAVASRRNVSPPWNQRAATKPLQLAVAARAGLRVPKTLITSDPAEVLAFADEFDGRIVHKAMTSPPHQFIDTRAWNFADAQHIGELSLCPAIFQQRIVGPADVRATIVGRQIFSACILTGRGRAGVDSRLDADAPCAPCQLPAEVESAIFRLMDELGLVFGTIDLKVADTGDHFFLEINPQGQFLYIEILTGLPISDAVAGFLACDPS
jgi:hypothetical protein